MFHNLSWLVAGLLLGEQLVQQDLDALLGLLQLAGLGQEGRRRDNALEGGLWLRCELCNGLDHLSFY